MYVAYFYLCQENEEKHGKLIKLFNIPYLEPA
jgi:hypothetical protein